MVLNKDWTMDLESIDQENEQELKEKTAQASMYLRQMADEIDAHGLMLWSCHLKIDTIAGKAPDGQDAAVPGRWRMLTASWRLAPVEGEGGSHAG